VLDSGGHGDAAMANRNDSTIQFFKKASPQQWSYLLTCYKDAVDAKAQLRTKKGGPEQYVKLDTWYQEALPKTLRDRKELHLEYSELVDIMKWKLMRTKYKPAALDLVKTNTEKNVKATTLRAFKRMPKLDNALQALTAGLKGIGTATASAILAAAFPDYAPYMAEECMESTPDVEAEDYTQAEYLKYAEHYQKFAQKLSESDPDAKWNPHKVELAIWSHYILRLHKPELLEKMPGQVESNGFDEESNQGAEIEGGTNGVSSSCDEDSQQSNGTIGQEDSNSVSATGNANGGSAKNGHHESNTNTDNDTRSSLPEEESSQPTSDLAEEASQDSGAAPPVAAPTTATPVTEEAAPVVAVEAAPVDPESAPVPPVAGVKRSADELQENGDSVKPDDKLQDAPSTDEPAVVPVDATAAPGGDVPPEATSEPECKKPKLDTPTPTTTTEQPVAVETQ